MFSDLKELVGTGIRFPACKDLYVIVAADLIGQDTLMVVVEPLPYGAPIPNYVKDVFISYQFHSVRWVSK